MYPRIPRELAAEPLGSLRHTLGITGLKCVKYLKRNASISGILHQHYTGFYLVKGGISYSKHSCEMHLF